jgi:AcrR family transcriptional regulator
LHGEARKTTIVSFYSHNMAAPAIDPPRPKTPMPRPKKAALAPRKEPRQSRSVSTVQAILQAAKQVLAKDALSGFNTNRVAEVAGVSIGSLYQYFPNKDALVVALIEENQAALLARAQAMAQALDGKPLQDKIAAVASLGIEQQFGNPIYAAALDHEERRLPLAKRLKGTEQTLGALGMAFFTPNLPHITPEEIRDVFAITKALVEVDMHLVRAPEGLHARLVRAISGYLGQGK